MTDSKSEIIVGENIPASLTGQRISNGQILPQSKKKKVDDAAARPIESLSSNDRSDGSSISSFFKESALDTKSQNNDNANSKSMASKQILNRFLKANAGAPSVREAIELQKKIMESDDDSSSTGTDFGQVWGLPTRDSHYTSDAPDYRSSIEGHNIDSDSDIDSNDASSIEIENRSHQRQKIHSSPVGRGMNGRHLCGRQRRLEAARSKNSTIQLFGENEPGDSSSAKDDGYCSDEIDTASNYQREDGNNGNGGHDVLSGNETSRKDSKPSASISTEIEDCNYKNVEESTFSAKSQVLASKLCEVYPRGPRNGNSTSEIQNDEVINMNIIGGSNKSSTNCIKEKELNRNGSGLSGGNMKANENQSTKKVSKLTRRIVKPKEPTTSSKPTIAASSAFDNLFSNGKDFFAWARITDPSDFLRHSKDYSSQVNEWRKERNLPLFNDTAGYIQKLRRQIRDNMKSIASKTKKYGNHNSLRVSGHKRLNAISKSEKRRKKKKKSIYPSTKDLPMEGNDFMTYMGIKNIEELFKRNDLHQHVNVWRKRQKLPLVDEYSCIATWRRWIRQNLKSTEYVVEENPPDEIDFSNCMKIVDCFSKRFLNGETGLPVYQFAVYDTLSTDLIYEFRVEAKPSLIPNAGNGAFMTFLGAREVKNPIREFDKELKVEMIQPLVSKDPEGYHMNIKLKGEHLQGINKCVQYPAPTCLPPIHGSPEERKIGTDKYPWTLKLEEKRLLSHYVENSDIVFSTNQIGCSVIEIGRYGPFRRSDRKFQLHYDLKNFIFSNETSEWGFDVVEDLNGHEQVADVTDDTTGMPHDVTRQNVCMYVNETGGDSELNQTVWSGQVFDREVNYYFKTEMPMKKGETIELLISYFGTYDEIRERKGYGERNKHGDVLSDDHFPSFLERNFVERYDMVEVIYELQDPMELYMLSEFLEKIRVNLASVIETFVRKLQSSSDGMFLPYAQQIIALRRLNWLKPYFLQKIKGLQKKVDRSKKKAISAIQKPVLLQCASNAERLDWRLWPTLMDLLDEHPDLVDKRGINLRTKFREEVTEDICYGVSSALFCPCNETIWCNTASTFTHDICYMIARNLWNHSETKSEASISEKLVHLAVKASVAIRNPTDIDALSFDTGIWKRYALNNRGAIAKEPRGTKCLMMMANDCKAPEKRLPAPFILRDDSTMDQKNILKNIHKPWYIARQILFVAEIFAQKYLGDDKTFSIEILYRKLGVTSDALSIFFKRKIELDLDSSLFYGKEFASIYSAGNKLNPLIERSIRKRSSNNKIKTKPKSSPVRKLLFWDILVRRLQESGWNIERGNRANDWYLLPPGVQRGKGFKPRIDFFDSAPLVINCLKTDVRYCHQPVIKSIMEEYGTCQAEFEKMKFLKNKELKTLSTKEIVENLRKKANTLIKKSDKADGAIQNSRIATVKVVFSSEQLGLLLYTSDGQVVVKGIKNLDFEKQINSGDVMIAVGDFSTRNTSLADVCKLVQRLGRPLTITFERKVNPHQNTSDTLTYSLA